MMKKIGYGVVGCGRVFPVHVGAITQDEDSELVAIYDINPEVAKIASEKFKVESKRSLDELLEDPRIDIVNICTPHHTHKDIILKVIQAGKYCLSEKPLCLNRQEGEEIIQSKYYKDNVFVCYQNRFNPAIQFLMKLIKEGTLGKLNLCSVALRWWRDDSYFADDWHGDIKKVGGAGFNQGAHVLDIMRQACGMPKDVQLMAKAIRGNSNVDDIFVANIIFENGAIGNIELTTYTRYKDWEVSMLVAGENGTVKIGGLSINKVEFLDVQNEELMKTYHQYSEEIKDGWGNSHPRVMKALNQYLLTGEKHSNLVSARDGLETTIFFKKIYKDFNN